MEYVLVELKELSAHLFPLFHRGGASRRQRRTRILCFFFRVFAFLLLSLVSTPRPSSAPGRALVGVERALAADPAPRGQPVLDAPSASRSLSFLPFS